MWPYMEWCLEDRGSCLTDRNKVKKTSQSEATTLHEANKKFESLNIWIIVVTGVFFSDKSMIPSGDYDEERVRQLLSTF